jgi:hypothetical protein
MSTKTATPRLSTVEQEKILAEAEGLIKEPANWTTGRWKCPVYKTDEKNRIIRGENGLPIPEYDLFNRPLAQYCIEGAVNQAAINVLGETRATRFGVSQDSNEMTEMLGLNEIARTLYAEQYDIDSAMEFNDDVGDHEGVMNILRTRLAEVRKKIKR